MANANNIERRWFVIDAAGKPLGKTAVKAAEILRAENFAVMQTDVVCISCPNVAGSLSAILEELAGKEIFIEYMYAFADGDKANVVIRPNDIDKCVEVLDGCACELRKF